MARTPSTFRVHSTTHHNKPLPSSTSITHGAAFSPKFPNPVLPSWLNEAQSPRVEANKRIITADLGKQPEIEEEWRVGVYLAERLLACSVHKP
jgi:hypothetical protein